MRLMRKLSQGEGIAVWLSVIIVLGAFLFANGIFGLFSKDSGSQANVGSALLNQEPQNMDNAQLIISDERVGTGAEATVGKTITVNYEGKFQNGEKFDSSYDRGEPFTFTLGAGDVIAGWDQGFAGMKVGGKRKIVVPPQLGYGPNDYGPIPGNSTLVFEVELLDVK
jgi:FKBP-type peptidyl-prolyl cis-trans isomerase